MKKITLLLPALGPGRLPFSLEVFCVYQQLTARRGRLQRCKRNQRAVRLRSNLEVASIFLQAVIQPMKKVAYHHLSRWGATSRLL